MNGRMRFGILGALVAATGIEFKVIWSEGLEEWERSEMKLGLDADRDSQRPVIRAGGWAIASLTSEALTWSGV